MVRRAFFSFHYQRDAWRASQVRNIGVVEGNPSASDNKWEEVKRGGDVAIRRWIDEQLTWLSCTIVLVGAETASRQWVKYEIEKSWNDGKKGLFGIRIHRLLDHSRQATVAGSNPFDQFTLKDGRKLSATVNLYDPPYIASGDVYAHISQNIGQWIKTAISSR